MNDSKNLNRQRMDAGGTHTVHVGKGETVSGRPTAERIDWDVGGWTGSRARWWAPAADGLICWDWTGFRQIPGRALRQSCHDCRALGLRKNPLAAGVSVGSSGRGEARWETTEEAGLTVQERADVGFSQEIKHRGRDYGLLFTYYVPDIAPDTFIIFSLHLGISIMSSIWGQLGI